MEESEDFHHAKFLLGGELDASFGKVEIRLIAGGKGLADAVGHEEFPLLMLHIFVGEDKGVVLQPVGRLAHLAGHIVIGTRFHELIDELQFLLAKAMKDVFGVIEDLPGHTPCRLVFLKIGADIQVELFAYFQHLHLGEHIEDGSQGYV